MTTNLMTAIRESGAHVWSTGCTTARDLDAIGSRALVAQRFAERAVDGTPHIGAAAAGFAKTTPGTTVWSPPT